MRAFTTLALAIIASLALSGGVALADNPSADADCAAVVNDPYLGPGTRADLYGCKPIGNSGEEQGIYVIHATAAELQYPVQTATGDCTVLVRWSGNYGGNPYLDFGTVFNLTQCSDGFVEVWGDTFGPGDAYGATPYVYSVGGQGSLIHP